MGRPETLAAVREKYPQYADMSDDQLGSALAAKYPAYADLASPAPSAGDTRSTGARLYQDYAAKPATNLLSKILEPALRFATAPLVDASRVAQGEPLGQVARTSATIFGEPKGSAASVADPLAQAIVPQTPLQAGMTVGTLGAAPAARAIPAVGRLAAAHPALTRILGAAAGGEAGNQVEGGTPGKGALIGGTTTALGEGLGALMSRLRPALPGGKGAVNAADARRIGETVEDIVPELGGVRTTEGIRAMTEGGGQAALGQAKEGTTRAVEGAINARPPMYGMPGTIQVPALGPAPMPLRAANDELSDIGARAFSRNPLDRNFNGVDQRRLYGDVARDISSGIGTAGGAEAAGAHEATQGAYSAGSKMLDFFKKSGVSDNDGFLAVAKMQRLLNNPKNAAILERHMGPENFKKFSDAVFRGAARGETDRVAPGMGGPLDALSQVLRGTNTGFSQSWRVPLATALPNIGSKYVGKNPLAIPDALRKILDLGAQRGATAMEEP